MAEPICPGQNRQGLFVAYRFLEAPMGMRAKFILFSQLNDDNQCNLIKY